MNYTTQMDAARKGIFTEEMQRVCEYENIRKEERGRRKEKSGFLSKTVTGQKR